MNKQTIGEFLQTMRKANGYTQQQVADILGVSNKTVSAWETDKACPDLMTIPAIADLYGVTADEIIRGERSTVNLDSNKNELPDNRLSDKCERAALKNRYLKFNTQSYALIIPVCAAAILIIPAMLISVTAGIALLVLAAVALIAAVTLQVVFYKNAIISADTENGAPLSPAQCDYRHDINNTLYRCIKIDGIAFLAAGILLLLLAIIPSAQNDSFSAIYFIIILIDIGCGTAAIVISKNHLSNMPPSQYSERQKAILAKNSKLRIKCVVAAIFACVVIFAASSVLLLNTFTRTQTLYSGSAEQIKRHLQTLIVDYDSTLLNDYGVAVAAYYFDLPEGDDIERYTTYDFENGFCGEYSYNYDFWKITYTVDANEGGVLSYVICYAQKVKIDDATTAYNVRYSAEEINYSVTAAGEGIYYLTPEYFVESSSENSDILVLKSTEELYIYEGYVIGSGVALAAITIIITTIIYLARRKTP